MEIDVQVIVVPDRALSTPGTIETDLALDDMLRDIVVALELGSPEEWEIAVSPRNRRTALAAYKPGAGDTVYVIKRDVARPQAFKVRR